METDLYDILLHAGRPDPDEARRQLDEAIARWPWFTAARVVRCRLTGASDPVLTLLAADRGGTEAAAEIDPEGLLHLTPADLIDRFLLEKELRIVAEEESGEGPGEEIVTEATFDEEDDLVSEELAEVYLKQGLRD